MRCRDSFIHHFGKPLKALKHDNMMKSTNLNNMSVQYEHPRSPLV